MHMRHQIEVEQYMGSYSGEKSERFVTYHGDFAALADVRDNPLDCLPQDLYI